MLCFDEARAIAQNYVSWLERDTGLDLTIVNEATIEREFGWVFFYESRSYLERGISSDRLAGNAPFIVERANGSLQVTGTAYPVEHYIAEFERQHDRARGAIKGVTILDRDPSSGGLSFDLRDLLSVLGGDAVRSTWTVRNAECLGGFAAAALHRASHERQRIAGDQLVELAREVDQTIDGEFSAYLPNEETAWIAIRAVDSTAFDVETTREDVVAALRATFDHVEVLTG